MTIPDPNADFVEQVLSTAHRMLSASDAPVEITDVQIAEQTGLELPTVRAVLLAEEGKRVTMSRPEGEDSWRVGRATPLDG